MVPPRSPFFGIADSSEHHECRTQQSERSTLGLGAGERLNEHIVGRGWHIAVAYPGTDAARFVGFRRDELRDAVR